MLTESAEQFFDGLKRDLLALDLEYKLSVATSLDCDCGRYLIYNRERLIPAILRKARQAEEDPVEMFIRFRVGLHERHLSGETLDA